MHARLLLVTATVRIQAELSSYNSVTLTEVAPKIVVNARTDINKFVGSLTNNENLKNALIVLGIILIPDSGRPVHRGRSHLHCADHPGYR